MHLLCPLCKNPIELVKFDPREEITCTSCGSSFRIDEGSTTGWIDNTAKSIGRFSIVESVGHGGFGTVFKAHDPELDRIVAVKVPRRGNVGEAPQDVDRFLREARSVAQLRHASIVSVHEVGMLDGTPYLVSDFVEGLTLSDLLTARRPAPREAAKLIAEVADALHHAHQQGVVHRDVKPSNIMVRPDGSPVVMDFGLAKRDAGEITMTMDGQVLGTPAYMSPEQARGEGHRVDGRSDIYSLGVILYLLLTCELPFRGNTRMLLHQVLHDEPKPPRSLNDKIPRDLETITLKAMAKEPAKRYATVADLASDLRRFLGGEPIVARPVGAIERAVKWVRRNPVVTGATIAVVLALAAGTAVSYLKYRDAETARAAEASRVQERDEALLREAARIEERDKALMDESERGKERDAALTDVREREARLKSSAAELKYNLGNTHMVLANVAYDNRDVRLAREYLDKVPPEQRKFEWGYRQRQVTGGIFTLFGHVLPVTSVAYSPDGTRIVSGSDDRTARVWNAKSGQALLELKGHKGLVSSVAYSPDGTRIVTGSNDRTARVWNAKSGQALLELKGHKGLVSSVAYSPDGTRIVSGSWDRMGKVWDAQSGKLLLDLNGHMGLVSSVAYSPDGTRIVSGSWDETAKVWDAKSGQAVLDLKGHTSSVYSVAYSPDGTRIVTGSSDNTAKVWDAKTGHVLHDLNGHTSLVSCVAYSPDGAKIASGSWDESAKVWDAKSGQAVLDLKGHTNKVSGVAFSPDGSRIVTGSEDNTAKLWDAKNSQPLLDLKGHTNWVQSVAYSPDATRIVTGSNDRTAKIWDTKTGQPLLDLKGHTNPVLDVAYSLDGTRIVTASSDNTASVWDAKTGKSLLDLKGHTSYVTSVAYSQDGAWIVSGSWDKMAKVWDARTGQCLLDLNGHTDGVTSVAFSPDGTRIVTGSWDKTAKVWDAKTGPALLDLKGHTSGVSSVAYSPDGTRIVTGSSDKTAKVWNAKSGQTILDLKGHTNLVRSVAYSPDGTRIVTGSSDHTAKVWATRTGQMLLDLKGHAGEVTSATFSPDGTRIITGSFDNTARIWDSRPNDDLDYRLFWTTPNLQRSTETFEAIDEANDPFAKRFHTERLLSFPQKFGNVELLDYRSKLTGDARLIARSSFHTPTVSDPYDREVVRLLAADGDRLAQRIVAQEFIRDGQPTKAVPLLHVCLMCRPLSAPPVEELLVARAFLKMNRLDDARNYYRAAADWLDRPRNPMRAANVVTHAINPWNALGEAFKPIDDPRHNTFDWESWHECDVFRAEVEKRLFANRP